MTCTIYSGRRIVPIQFWKNGGLYRLESCGCVDSGPAGIGYLGGMQLVLPFFCTLRRFTGFGFAGKRRGLRLRREVLRRGTFRISPKKDLTIQCVEGCIWITTRGNDVILEQGCQFILRGGPMAVIEGLEPSVVEIVS